MSPAAPHQILAELEQLGRHPDRLVEFAPALRSTLQSLKKDRARALRAADFMQAEHWRRCSARAGWLLQGAEDRA